MPAVGSICASAISVWRAAQSDTRSGAEQLNRLHFPYEGCKHGDPFVDSGVPDQRWCSHYWRRGNRQVLRPMGNPDRGVMSISDTYSNYSADWWTPPEWMQWVRRTLGCEPFDPCPANWNPGMGCGLEREWMENAYVNHPGSRGSTAKWWSKALKEMVRIDRLIWCAFSVEQLRHMSKLRSPMEMDGWLIMPRDRVSFVWGGECAERRRHGVPATSPAHWAIFWSTVPPHNPPQSSLVVRTCLR